MFDLIYANSSFLGYTGYANHSREFFTSLNKLIPVRVRNYAHVNDLSYLTKEQKDMVIYQTWNGPPHEVGTQFNINDYSNVLTIVLNETNHYYFYDKYNGPKIAYNVWESTLQPQEYFNKLLEFDQLWVPTEWQRQCSINQGYPSERVFVVPEAVDPDFVPEDVSNKPEEYNDDRFKFIIFGRWDYRKSITEIIKSFLEEFKSNEPVDLILSVDNPFSIDGLNSTEERLNHHNLNDPRIKVKHKVSREDYIKYIKTGHCFLSCAKGEGWNIPLIEAMAAGTPSIYSNWGAQLEFAEGLGHPVKIIGEVPAKFGEGSSFSENIPGNYCEPDFDDLKKVMRHVYENYSECKEKAVEESNIIREKYTWENSTKIAYKIIENFWDSYSKLSASINDINRVDFKWVGESGKKIEGRIIEPYTGLNFYRCEINVKKNVNYFFQCGGSVGNKIKYKLFEIVDSETNEVLFSKYSDNGNYDLKDIDKERHLKDYYKIMPVDNAIAVPLYEIFIDEVYNQNFCSVEKGDIVVDIGSSAGFFSTYAYYKGCKVCYSFEPLTSLYNAAKEQLKNIPNLILENKAVDNFNGKTFIYTDKDDTIGSSLHDPKKKNNNLKVKKECKVINFMDMIKEKNIEKIDYLKIDCEGSEYNIINSIPDDYLKNNIKKITMEYHYNTDGRLKNILDRLESLGFEVDFRKGCHIDGDLGIVYARKKFNFDKFIKPYEDFVKKTGISRYNFYKYVIPKLVSKRKPLYIIETGTMWSSVENNMGAFTYIFGDLIKNWTGGKLITIDISEDKINSCKETTKEFSSVIDYVHCDSVKYLKSLSDDEIEKIDLFYLDSYDLNLTNQEPSAQHHLNELKAIYERVSQDSIISVDDNYLPGTEIEWVWFDKDGNISGRENVYTKNNIIGKGFYVNSFLLKNGWKRISQYDVGGQNNVFYYERLDKINKIDVSNILNKFYLSKNVTKPTHDIFKNKKITNREIGLGDTILLTPFTKHKIIDSISDSFGTLMLYNKDFINPFFNNTDDVVNIVEFAKYNWKGGNAIQRIGRALGLPEIVKPKGRIDIEPKPIKNRVGYHIERGSYNINCLSDEAIKLFNEFISDNENEYEFIDLSYNNSKLNLRQLIDMLLTCEYFIGINSGIMHLAACMDIKSIIIANHPQASELYLPKISEVEIMEMEFLYPQNVHLHTNGSNELVPKYNKVNLKRALNGDIYPYWSDEYLDINIKEDKINFKYNINTHFVDGPFAEIKGSSKNNSEYLFEFIDLDNNSVVHKDNLKINHWSRVNRKYFTNWLIRIKHNEKNIIEHKLDLNNKNVLISFDSKSLGDTIAWFPYVEEFRKKHKCNVFVSTFWNKFFRGVEKYKNLEIVNPGKTLHNLYASYSIGCYDNNLNKNRYNWRTIPLQKVASDMLGLEYKEIITDINFIANERPIKEKYVALTEHSTFKAKYYNRENGWQEIVDYLNSIGYKVMVISKEKTNLKNIIDMTNKPIEVSMNNIYHSEFLMGVSSGPIWISWALRKPVLLVSGFTDTFVEFKTNCYRVINKHVCNSCCNDVNFSFNRGDWNLCKWKGTERQFECTKTITKEMITEKINYLLREK